MMKYTLLWLIALTFFSGCFNERGVSLRYYNGCEEYYDAQGYYHKKCEDNMVDYSEIKRMVTPAGTDAAPKVW
jgi:hypothetical protein